MKNITKEEYKKLVGKKEKSTVVKDIIWAFVIGGAICVLGQLFKDIYVYFELDKENASAMASVTLIFLSGLFTGLGLYEKLASHAGAGTLVPITGFANAMVSPAIEFKNEGLIFGVGSKLFVIAGPVIVYGVSASIIGGLIYYFFIAI